MINLNEIDDVRQALEMTKSELTDIDNGIYPDLGITYEVSEDVLRASYRKTMERQRDVLIKRLEKMEKANE